MISILGIVEGFFFPGNTSLETNTNYHNLAYFKLFSLLKRNPTACYQSISQSKLFEICIHKHESSKWD